jgi:arylsulfatase A
MADVFVEKTKAYLAQQKTATKPFFLYFASQDIHVPRAPHPRFKGKTKLGHRGDAMVQFDWSTGEILKALEDNGLAENTIVIFSSDNGPVYDDGYDDGTVVRTSTKEVDNGHDGSGVYRGGKYQIYEGGTRVPFIVRWPGRITPGTSDALFNQVDLLGSFAKLLQLSIPKDHAADSRDALDAILGKDPTGLKFTVEEAMRSRALRQGNWKYIASRKGKGKSQLYDLENDASEQHNVISKHPEIAESMAKQLKEIIQGNGIR